MNNHWQRNHPFEHRNWQNNPVPSQRQNQSQSYPPAQLQHYFQSQSHKPVQTQHQFQPLSHQPNQSYSAQGWNRRINIYEAMEIANQRVPGDIVKVELEREQGMLVYEVEVMTQEGMKYEIDVNVETGEVMNVKLD